MDRCELRRCRGEVSVIYLGHGVCERCWNELTAEDAPPGALRMGLGIEATAESAMEEAMDDGSRKTAKAEATSTGASGKKKATKVAKPKRAPKAKEPKAKREPIQDAVVFAFRLSAEQRDRIHKAAGSGKATRFVRGAALAAANGDTKAFEEIVASRASK